MPFKTFDSAKNFYPTTLIESVEHQAMSIIVKSRCYAYLKTFIEPDETLRDFLGRSWAINPSSTLPTTYRLLENCFFFHPFN